MCTVTFEEISSVNYLTVVCQEFLHLIFGDYHLSFASLAAVDLLNCCFIRKRCCSERRPQKFHLGSSNIGQDKVLAFIISGTESELSAGAANAVVVTDNNGVFGIPRS
jgi:hypothetical protein